MELFRQIGQPPDQSTVLSDTLDATVPVHTQSLADVMAARADVAAAREAVLSAEAELKLQRALGVPDFDLLGGYKRNAGNNTIYSNLQIPLAFRNRNQGEIARAEANVHLMKDRLMQLQLSVGADVAAVLEA